MEIISNSDKSNDLPVLDNFIHQVFDPKATSAPIRELSQLEEAVTVNSSVDYMNCPMPSKAEECNPKPGTSKVLPPNEKHYQLPSESSKLEEIIRTFDVPSSKFHESSLEEKASRLKPLISKCNSENTNQNELVMESQFKNKCPIVDRLNVSLHPELTQEPSMSEEGAVRNDFTNQGNQKCSSGCIKKGQCNESFAHPSGNTELKNIPSILEDLIKNPNSDYRRHNEHAVKSNSTSTAASLLEERGQIFDNRNQEETRATPLQIQMVETGDSRLEPNPQSELPIECLNPTTSSNTKIRVAISSEDILQTSKINEPRLSELETIIQSYSMTIGQSSNFTIALRFGMNAVFTHVGQLIEQYSKFASFQR